jgi:uncharacterized membrane protein
MRLPILILHILGGSIGLASGAFAIAIPKGSRLHRASGIVFTIAMLTLASSALVLRSSHPKSATSYCKQHHHLLHDLDRCARRPLHEYGPA